MTCICIDDLRAASFRGVPFFVANDKGDYGRRNVVHEYPLRDKPYVEDMGEKARKYSVSGYLFGDDWIAKKDALIAACTARGPALLQLPAEGPKLVACNTLAVSRTKDECGFFAVNMEFVSADNFGVPAVVGVIESLIGAVIAAAVPSFTSYFDANYTPDNVAQFAVDRQTARVVRFTADVIGAVESTPAVDGDLSTDVVQAAISVYQNAADYAQPDTSRSVYLASQPVPSQTIAKVAGPIGFDVTGQSGITVSSGAAAIVPMIAHILTNLGNSLSADEAVTALTPFASWSVQETTVDALIAASRKPLSTAASNPVSSSELADAQNGTLFCGMVRSFALMKLAQALSVKKFATRMDAVQARANIVELFNMQIALFDEDSVVNVLLKARDLAVQSLSQNMASIVPIITIIAPQSMPSLYWAHRLYEDTSRAEELADRNGVASPAFMPPQFEALAR